MDTARMEQGKAIARGVLDHLRDGELLREAYPSLFTSGVSRGSFHSYMLSALLLLGHHIGYSAVVDCPLFDPLDKLLSGEGAKRPDSIWFERGTETVRSLFEFESYNAEALEAKAKNLILMANACRRDIQLLALMYWTGGPRTGRELGSAADQFKRGFKINGNTFGPAPCAGLILETLTHEHDNRVILSGFVARQFVFGREEKPYVVEELNQQRGS